MSEKDITKTKSAYDYSAENDSFLDHILYKKIIPVLLEKVIPWGLPANIITICANSCVTIAFIIAMLSTKNIYTLWFAIPFLILFYLLGDCTDGCQARRTHTGSPLGEYMDHFLDCFVNAELMIPMAVCYKLTNSWVIFILLFMAYLTQAAAFWERYSLGHMHFAKFSSSETVVGLDIVVTLAYFSKIVNFGQNKLSSFAWASGLSDCFLGNLTLAELGICFFILGATFSTTLNFIRTKGASVRFWIFAAELLLIAVLSALNNVSYHYLPMYIICLYGIDYIADLITAIVDKKKDPYPDFVLPAVMLIAFILGYSSAYLLIGELVYISVKLFVRTVIFIYRHRNYWFWKNPLPVNA